MQIIEYYKEVLQENLKIVVDFINSAEKEKMSAVGKSYEKTRKKPRLS